MVRWLGIESDVLEIIDHDCDSWNIDADIFRNQPLKCISTIIYLMYSERGLKFHIVEDYALAIISHL